MFPSRARVATVELIGGLRGELDRSIQMVGVIGRLSRFDEDRCEVGINENVR